MYDSLLCSSIWMTDISDEDFLDESTKVSVLPVGVRSELDERYCAEFFLLKSIPLELYFELTFN